MLDDRSAKNLFTKEEQVGTEGVNDGRGSSRALFVLPKSGESVTSSAYSRAPPTGRPRAIRERRTPLGFRSRARYRAVASPSMLGFVATIISSTPSDSTRSARASMVRSSGPTPSRGEMAPVRT